MAGPREPVDPDASRRLLQSKLKLLQGDGVRRSNLALDILTGRTPSSPPEDSPEDEAASAATPPAPVAATPTPAERPRRTRRPANPSTSTVRAHTVYLSDQELQDVEFIVRAWRRRLGKRVSRSEVLRQAIGSLRDAVELGAAPRMAERPGEGGASHA